MKRLGFGLRLMLGVGAHALISVAANAYGTEQSPVDFTKVFHKVGVPNVRRDARINISLAADRMIFVHDKTSHEIAYTRIRNVTLLHGDRVYEKTTYVAAVATGLGAFMIMKKHPVDTVVIDYENESGGHMGIVVQLEIGRGTLLIGRLAEQGVTIIEPHSPVPQPQLEPDRKERK